MRLVMSSQTNPLETVLKRDRAVVAAGLAAVTLLAWAYILYLARRMGGMDNGMDSGGGMDGMTGMAGGGMDSGMDGMAGGGGMAAMGEMAGPLLTAWSAADFLLMFLMWAVMMAAMMLPSAAPMLLAFAAVNRRRRESGHPFVPTAIFLGGYLLAWGGFSLAATLAQGGLHSAALLSPQMALAGVSPILGGILLLAAGLFQWTPLKQACLHHCRTPMGFLTADWREGRGGALRMGLRHGGYCLGCCWALMGLLFVLGVMNLLWIFALSALVLAEKALPGGRWLGRLAGVGLLAWGAALILAAVLR